MKKGEDFVGVTVTFICHDGQGNYLLAKRSDQCRDEHHRWDAGGGALELGDTVEETLKKEICEEYCADVLDHEFLGYRDVFRENEDKKNHWLALDFKVLVNRDLIRIGEPHKFEDIGWFRMDAFPEPLHSQLPHFIEKYKAHLT